MYAANYQASGIRRHRPPASPTWPAAAGGQAVFYYAQLLRFQPDVDVDYSASACTAPSS